MKNSYDRYEFLWHAYDMNLHHMMLVYVNSYDIMKSYIKWCWCPFSSDWNHHVKMLATMLCWLRKMALPFAYSQGRQRDWLDWIMAYAMMFILYKKENIDAILHMDWPCNATELCMFIGYVNYYCTCRRVAHISLNLKWFRIHTNASDFQLGTCIIQEGKLVAYFSCNWQCHSKNYTTLEQ